MKSSRYITMVAVALCVAAGQQAYAQNKETDGTWRLDIAKSDFGKTAPPKSMTLKITSTQTSIKWVTKEVGADGKSQTESYSGAADDQYYPIKGGRDGATFAYMKDGSSLAVKDKSGKVVETGIWSLSADGKTMTLHLSSHNPAGDMTHDMVYQKIK